MFCSRCGEFIEEGKAFCKNCGAPVSRAPENLSDTSPSAASQQSSQMLRQAVPSPPPSPSPSPSPPPPPLVNYGSSNVYPPQAGPVWPNGPSGPTGPTGPKGRTGLIWGIIAAAIIVLAGAGVGSYFAFFRDAGDVTETSMTVVMPPDGVGEVTISTAADLGASNGVSATSVARGSTAQTIPALTTTTGGSSAVGGSSVAGGPSEAYMRALYNLTVELDYDDTRIPELAAEINNTAPGVPVWVRDELSTMLGSLDGFNVELASIDVPRGFEDSYHWIEEAALHMGNRIYATIQGIEAIWDDGEVSEEAAGFFDEGRIERDSYREAMEKYYEVLPVDFPVD